MVSGRHAHALPMFQQVLLFIHSMRLVLAPIDRIEWALSGLYNRALPSPNEAVVLKQPLPKGKSAATWPDGSQRMHQAVLVLWVRR